MFVSKDQKGRGVIFGGDWLSASVSGSRVSYWNLPPSASGLSFSARAVCDHLNLDALNESEEVLDVCK